MMITLGTYLAKHKIPRCGVILYTIIDGELWFCLPRDKKTREAGDFGGGAKNNEYALETALRELYEESRGLFRIDPNECKDKVALVDEHSSYMTILFLPIAKEYVWTLSDLFASQPILCKSNDEVSGVLWLNEQTFLSLIERRRDRRLSPKEANIISSHIFNDTVYQSKEKIILWQKIYRFLSTTYTGAVSQALRIAYRYA